VEKGRVPGVKVLEAGNGDLLLDLGFGDYRFMGH
jgi:hypothetical protein